jgi:YidC/Oxa1 family membrane protein insertase
MAKPEQEQPKVLIAPSWQADNILDSCIDPLLEELLGKGFSVVVRPHPEYMKRYRPRMEQIVQRWQGKEDLRFELDFSGNESIFNSDLLITDWSGTAYEFSFVTLKPAVFVDTPPKINNPEYEKLGVEPLEFALRDQVGIRVKPEELTGLAERLKQLLENVDANADKIETIRNTYIANFGQSGKVGGRYILQQLTKKK